jgi:hypothetical protein
MGFSGDANKQTPPTGFCVVPSNLQDATVGKVKFFKSAPYGMPGLVICSWLSLAVTVETGPIITQDISFHARRFLVSIAASESGPPRAFGSGPCRLALGPEAGVLWSRRELIFRSSGLMKRSAAQRIAVLSSIKLNLYQVSQRSSSLKQAVRLTTKCIPRRAPK